MRNHSHKAAVAGILALASILLGVAPTSPAPSPSPAAAPATERMAIGADPTCIADVPGVPISVCFKPNALPREVAEVTRVMQAAWNQNLADRDAESEGGVAYNLGTRWNIGGSSAQGQPVSLRWSMPADGLSIPDDLFGGAASPNNLNATFTTKFGSVEAGKNLLRAVFAKWSELSGVTYVEVTDDNAAWGTAGGTTRGDIRIVGRSFSATSVLAYNFFPNNGDMVIVTSNSGAWSAANNNRYFRNIIAHEHGHGLGISHVCPTNQTKLMEPFLSTAFDGPQNDDMRAVQRAYGDNYEPNDTAASANTTVITGLGTFTKTDCSLDDFTDADFYRFSAAASSTVSVTVAPVGPATYLSGPQNADGSCSAGTSLSPRIVQDLNVQIVRGTTTTTVLATAAASTTGGTETLSNIVMPATDTYAVRVYSGGGSADSQLYSMSVTVTAAPLVPGDINGDHVIDGTDLALVLAAWGPCGSPCPTDVDGSGTTDGGDLTVVLANWG